MYTLGAFMISADDDMRPHALIESSPESLNADEISRGKLLKRDAGGVIKKLSPVTSKPASQGRIKTSHSEVLYSYQISICRQGAKGAFV